MTRAYKVLNDEQVSQFLEQGWVRIPAAFTREQAAEWTRTLWERLGYSPTDKSTWAAERINMAHHNWVNVRTFAPKAFDAICDLVGGEERLNPKIGWSDGFLVSFGADGLENTPPAHPKELPSWHVDGDHFIHFLDSPEQALLVICLVSDVRPSGGGTMLCPESIGIIAEHLRDHPDGVSIFMDPNGPEAERAGDPAAIPELRWYVSKIKSDRCQQFVELTGNAGDVILLHPFLIHAETRNHLRIPRVVLNPNVALKEPFQYDRERKEDYSLVEEKTLRALGVWEQGGLKGWKITGQRGAVVPERARIQKQTKELEKRRLSGENVG